MSLLTVQQKEVDYLKVYEQDKGLLYQKKYKELVIEHQKLKDSFLKAKYIYNGVEPAKYIVKENPNGKRSIMIYLSDMHIGSYVSKEGVYDNQYDEAELNRRLSKILAKLSSYDDLDEIIIINLGDAIDGYNAQTTRSASTHILPQNMSNKEQGQVLLRQMSGFLSIFKIIFLIINLNFIL